MKYLSICSGIEAATCAWHHMGWNPVAFSEIEPFPSAVLAHHYPNVPNWGDMTKFEEWPNESIDLLVGGTPCQSFSVAGLRKGLDDPRGNLMLTFGSIARRYRPEWLVWENVPGVLSSNRGRDFGTFLGMLAELGYGFAYRVLDAQYFGVAQRRRRVFVVGNLRDWHRAAAVLFERESLRGNPAPSRKQKKDVANCISASPSSGGSPNIGNGQGNIVGTLTARMGGNPMGAPEVDGGMYIPWPAQIAPTLNAAFGSKQGLEDQHALGGAGLFVPAVLSSGQTNASVSFDKCPSLDCLHESPIAFHNRQNPDISGHVTHPLGAKDNGMAFMQSMQVRRLTPVECERLQGFPDGYTNIPWRKKPESPDGPRYKALGNSMAVPVMKWIGERINIVNTLT